MIERVLCWHGGGVRKHLHARHVYKGDGLGVADREVKVCERHGAKV